MGADAASGTKLGSMAFNEILIYDNGSSITLKRSERRRQVLTGFETQYGPTLASLRDKVTDEMRGSSRRAFGLTHDGIRLKVRTVETVSGPVHSCRRLLDPLPTFGQLQGMEDEVRRQMLDLALRGQAGLVTFTGLPNSGKSTTMVSLLLQNMRDWGDVGVFLEDDPEFELEGKATSGKGRIFQISTRDAASSYEDFIAGVLALSPRYACVGSLSRNVDARLALDLALAGVLVSTTINATSVVAGLSNLVDRASASGSTESAREAVALTIRACVHQSLEENVDGLSPLRRLKASTLFFPNPAVSAMMAKKVREGNVQGLAQDMSMQETRVKAHNAPLEAAP